jgi:hypothetical protein
MKLRIDKIVGVQTEILGATRVNTPRFTFRIGIDT